MLLSNPATDDIRPLKEARALTSHGFRVMILAWDRERSSPRESLYADGVIIRRFKVSGGYGQHIGVVVGFVLYYVWCLYQSASLSFRAVHCHDVDTLPLGIILKLTRFGKVRLVYDMHDLPEVFLGHFPLSTALVSAAMSLARSFPDRVLVVNDSFVGYLGGLGFDADRLCVIMNVPALDEGAESAHRRESVEMNILYYGDMDETRGVKELVAAAANSKSVSLLLAGRGSLDPWLKTVCLSTANIKCLGWVPVEKLAPLTRRADLIPSLYYPTSPNQRLATPGKLFTALSLGIPALVPQGCCQAELVTEYDCGLAVGSRNAAEVGQAIERLCHDRELYIRLGVNALEAFRERFNWEVMERRLAALYEQLTTSI